MPLLTSRSVQQTERPTSTHGSITSDLSPRNQAASTYSPRREGKGPLARSYVILNMGIRTVTWANPAGDDVALWLHDISRSGVRAVRWRSLALEEVPGQARRRSLLSTF
jgi:hypothetical protein